MLRFAATAALSSTRRINRGATVGEQVIVFTKYPAPGSVKTRLIPAIGPELAAKLHETLTRQTLVSARRIAELRRCGLQVHFTGGDVTGMQQLFGSDLQYESQTGDGLGERLESAVSSAFCKGVQRLIVVGSDCPDLSAEIINRAFHALETADVVLGPAADGGYYLIGLRRKVAELFRGIDWGTDRVLRQTRTAARAANCSLAQLECLSDIDYVDDLIACRRVAACDGVLPEQLPGLTSVVIPTFNEEQVLGDALARLQGVEGIELIVADGGSRDGTVTLARDYGARVVHAPCGRGRQLNAGAALAQGETLLFLHVDTALPRHFPQQIESVLGDGAIAGAFRLRINDPTWALRWVERGANLRSSLLNMPYGDQGLFLRASTFYELGGFRPWPLMEDYEMSRRLSRYGRVRIADADAITSARRWRRVGIARTTLFNQMCIAAYHLGVSAEKIAQWYRSR